MCGRYYVDDETAREIEKLVRQVDERLRLNRPGGDIYPGGESAVLENRGDGLIAVKKRWGFPGFQNKKLLFNARSETALEKPTFRDSLLHRRCVIPAAWFYEWDPKKQKFEFFREDFPLLFMAGFYKLIGGEERFVILTRQANRSVADIHSRMPLILEQKEIEPWIGDGGLTEYFLQKDSCLLKRRT